MTFPTDPVPVPDVVAHIAAGRRDACAPNTLIGDDGRCSGHVDLGDLGVADRWSDLAVASMSLDWNFERNYEADLFDAYGVTPDEARIAYYRARWEE
ncbi:phosphotransferase [Mycobacterium sp. RTGN3]|uniref:phosphotransferase n=1 Tax=unclassified Mycobacterium TaxID=2642494 RepID=UPI0039B01CE0